MPKVSLFLVYFYFVNKSSPLYIIDQENRILLNFLFVENNIQILGKIILINWLYYNIKIQFRKKALKL